MGCLSSGAGLQCFDPHPRFRAKVVEAQTVGNGVDLGDQPGAERSPLRRVDLALEYGFCTRWPKSRQARATRRNRRRPAGVLVLTT
jgi:hypothetical protein